MEKKVVVIGIFVILFCGLVFSCASILKGPNDKVNFGSVPEKAKVYVNGQLMGETPLQLKLQSKQTYNIEFRKEGYETKIVQINNKIGAGWIILDILFGLIPVIVDAATGDWFYLDQTNVNTELEKQQ